MNEARGGTLFQVVTLVAARLRGAMPLSRMAERLEVDRTLLDRTPAQIGRRRSRGGAHLTRA